MAILLNRPKVEVSITRLISTVLCNKGSSFLFISVRPKNLDIPGKKLTTHSGKQGNLVLSFIANKAT
jgi:hypothetical protein